MPMLRKVLRWGAMSYNANTESHEFEKPHVETVDLAQMFTDDEIDALVQGETVERYDESFRIAN